jgi:hypothetical protein
MVTPSGVVQGIASDWPHGRGCYISKDKQFIVWVGEEDHLRIMCMKKGTMLNEGSSAPPAVSFPCSWLWQ